MSSESQVNVLLVDDHPENLIALEAILESLGQNLVKAYSGKEALRCLLNQDFAVILLDVQMPDMDGFETATLIRQRERSRDTPIIFLTAFSTSENLVFKGYSVGAVDYLFKPIEAEVLKSKVGVFVELFKKTAKIKQQAAQLAALNAELKTSEERFRCLCACSPVGIFLTDIEGHCTYTNPRFQSILGSQSPNVKTLAATSYQQADWIQSIHPEDREEVLSEWLTWTQKDLEYSQEFRIQTQTGNICWVHVRSSPMLSDHGELLGHVGTVEDITERKQAEEERAKLIREQVARQEAEAANRMKDEFLAILSHELRTPLNSMLGWARLLRSRKFDEATTARALETIERNATLQAQLIEDILDVSRIIRGKLRLNLRSLNLKPIIEAALDSVRPLAEAKEISLERTLNCSPDLVCADGERLQQVIWNLLANAIKFTPEGGKVEVRLSTPLGSLNSKTEPQTLDSYIQIQVIDTGIGISPDFLPHVFDRFRQADGTTTRSHGGLGLGLAIVRHLVEMHGGTVEAASAGEDKGATFTVNLLLAAKQEQTLATHQANGILCENITIANPPSLDNLHVLIVDDDVDTLNFLKTILEEAGAKVTSVTSAQEALAVFQQTKLDILISDLGMPEEDGYSLIRKVRNLETEQGSQIKAAALTAYVQEQDYTTALAAGFQMYLAKPVMPLELIAVVANLAGRE